MFFKTHWRARPQAVLDVALEDDAVALREPAQINCKQIRSNGR